MSAMTKSNSSESAANVMKIRLRFGAIIAGFLASNVGTVAAIALVTLIFPRVMASSGNGLTAETLTFFVSVEALGFGLIFSVLGGWVIAAFMRPYRGLEQIENVDKSIWFSGLVSAALAAIVQLLLIYPYDSTAPAWYRVSLLILTIPAYILGLKIGFWRGLRAHRLRSVRAFRSSGS